MEDQGVDAVPPDFEWPQWPIVQPVGPFKCPDCGTWWAAGEHRCQQWFVYTTDTNPSPLGRLEAFLTGSVEG